MAKIIGFGGIFIKSPDPEKLKLWYKNNLELSFESWGLTFDLKNTPEDRVQVFSVFSNTSDYIPAEKQFMLNFAVDDLAMFVELLKSKNIDILKYEESDCGKFAWIQDIDGNKIEFWETPKPNNE